MEPVLMLVVPDPDDRQRMVDELGRYGRDYRVEARDGTPAATERLAELHASGERVAMVVAEDVDLLTRLRAIAPTAHRVALVDWGLHESQARRAMAAAALGHVDAVVTKPTGPRDEELHSVLTEELREWAWTTTPPVEAVKVVDEIGSARAAAIRDLLERHGVPTGVYEPSSSTGRAIVENAPAGAPLPLVEVMSGTLLAGPTNLEIADAFGLRADLSATYDLAVVGAGPAGLAAAVYGASEGLTTIVVEGQAFGGQAGTSSMIRNYLGFPAGITGRQLGRRAVMQAARFGAAMHLARDVTAIVPGDPHRLALSDGTEVRARAVVLACGVTYRRLGVPAVEALVGAGVFYGAATTHARALEGGHAVIVGAGNSGGQAAVHLAKFAERVTIAARGPSLAATMSAYLLREIEANDRIEVRTGTEVVDGGGDGRLEWLELAPRGEAHGERVGATGLFVLIGTETRTAWLPPAIQRDDRGFVLTGSELGPGAWPLDRPPLALETSVPGIFAAGDVRANGVKRVAAAVGEGSISVPMVHRYLADR